MYYFIAWFVRPYTLLLLLTSAALFGMWRRHRDARRRALLLMAPLLALVVLSTPAVAFLAMGTLEWAYPPTTDAPNAGDIIVVLTGSMRAPDAVRARAELGENSIYRCQHAAALYERGEPCVVLVSGGKVHRETPGPPCSEVMRDYLVQLGVESSHLLVEDRSRTTYESALNCPEVFRPKSPDKVFLVTEATHMRRSVACFRSQGIEVIPAACHHRATEFRLGIWGFLPSASALVDVEAVAHEWIGLTWYWLHGRI